MADTEGEILETEPLDGEVSDPIVEGDANADPDNEDGDWEVGFGDEAAPASESDTPLIKHLRDTIKDQAKRLREVQSAPPKIEIGERPTREGCEYDDDRYDEELLAWNARKAESERTQTAAQAEAEQAQKAWSDDLDRHQRQKQALKVPDIGAAEEIVTATLSNVQQAVIVKAAEDSAKVIYALSKHPAKLAELSKIADPIKLAAAVAKLEGTIRMGPRRKAPDPEEIARGGASVSTVKDEKLERLEAEADKTGNRTKLLEYKRQLRAKQK